MRLTKFYIDFVIDELCNSGKFARTTRRWPDCQRVRLYLTYNQRLSWIFCIATLTYRELHVLSDAKLGGDDKLRKEIAGCPVTKIDKG